MVTYVDHSFKENYNIDVCSHEKDLLIDFCKEARNNLRENHNFGCSSNFNHNLDLQFHLIVENLESERHIDIESILKVINHYSNLKTHENKRNGGE